MTSGSECDCSWLQPSQLGRPVCCVKLTPAFSNILNKNTKLAAAVGFSFHCVPEFICVYPIFCTMPIGLTVLKGLGV